MPKSDALSVNHLDKKLHAHLIPENHQIKAREITVTFLEPDLRMSNQARLAIK
jgi:hypothetical protein